MFRDGDKVMLSIDENDIEGELHFGTYCGESMVYFLHNNSYYDGAVSEEGTKGYDFSWALGISSSSLQSIGEGGGYKDCRKRMVKVRNWYNIRQLEKVPSYHGSTLKFRMT
jgi:hypothetical protein